MNGFIDRSHIFLLLGVLLSFFLIFKFGVDRTSYLGFEVPIVIISLAIILFLLDVFRFYFGGRFELKQLEGYAFVAAFLLILLVIIGIDKFNKRREQFLLNGYTEEAKAVFIKIGAKPFFSSPRTYQFRQKYQSLYIYYRYKVNGNSYTQADVFFPHSQDVRNIPKEFKIKYSVRNPQVSQIVHE